MKKRRNIIVDKPKVGAAFFQSALIAAGVVAGFFLLVKVWSSVQQCDDHAHEVPAPATETTIWGLDYYADDSGADVSESE